MLALQNTNHMQSDSQSARGGGGGGGGGDLRSMVLESTTERNQTPIRVAADSVTG